MGIAKERRKRCIYLVDTAIEMNHQQGIAGAHQNGITPLFRRVELGGPLGDTCLQLTGMFLNLLINSAQAMKGQGEIEMRVSAGDGDCAVVITDTGPGIPPEVRGRLFTPFVTTKSRGTGLGLSTVKRLIEAHHGSISVESPASGGARITVRLPLA